MPTVREPDEFRFIDPPFQFNAPGVARYPVEVTGFHLLASLHRRLGWTTLTSKRVLDFGCGVRFARTIYNLDIDIGLYAGVDVNADAIAWLSSNVDDPRFRFARFDMRNAMYNPAGSAVLDVKALRTAGFTDFDAACMFSVITHQAPADAQLIFALLHETVRSGGQLYFTAFTDEDVDGYIDRDADQECHLSTYHPDYLRNLVSNAGWRVDNVYPKTILQQTGFLCSK